MGVTPKAFALLRLIATGWTRGYNRESEGIEAPTTSFPPKGAHPAAEVEEGTTTTSYPPELTDVGAAAASK